MTDQTEKKSVLENYLLGRNTDPQQLGQIEDRLADDEEFSQIIEIVEDDLIEQYLQNSLESERRKDFERIFLDSKTRRQKIVYLQALYKYAADEHTANSVASEPSPPKKSGLFGDFFMTRKLVFGGAALALIPICIFSLWLFVFKSNDSADYIARLDALYGSKRPVEGRIVDFAYSPYLALRGEDEKADDAKRRTLRKIEYELIDAIEKNSTSENHNLLGVFYLTESKYDESIKEFEHALEINENNSEARNNLGVAYFEKSKLETEESEKLKLKARALEESSRAINEGNVKPETLFNKALILQEMNIPRQAIEAWQEYLKADAASKWADEARRNLNILEKRKNTSFKTKEKILEDFLDAFTQGNETLAWTIHSQTKEFNSNKFLPTQLIGKYLEVEESDRSATAAGYLTALEFIGESEKRKNGDRLFFELAAYYSGDLPEIKKKRSADPTDC
jgi:tetratricopeptide (TPR) repeat protein